MVEGVACSRGVGGSLSHLWKFRGGGGSSVPCKNGKSREVAGGGGVLSKIPSVVGVWIFSGTTPSIFTQKLVENHEYRIKDLKVYVS